MVKLSGQCLLRMSFQTACFGRARRRRRRCGSPWNDDRASLVQNWAWQKLSWDPL
jgi:hypothetical protein